MTTPRLGAPELVQSQAVPETTVNEQIRYVEQGAHHFVVKDRDLATPPGSPADGDCYLVAASPTGAWSGQAGKLAFYLSTAWAFITAKEGMTAYVNDEDALLAYDGAAWNTVGGGGGGATTLNDLTDVDTTGATSGQVLGYDGAQWEPTTVGEVTGLEGSGSILRFAYGNSPASGLFTQVGVTLNNQGSGATPAIATTNRITRTPGRHVRSTGAGAGASAGLQSQQGFWREVGFTYEFRGGIETLVAGARLFIGVRGSTGLTLNVDPSSWLQIVGFGLDAADTNIQLMHNDGAGTATKTDTGIAKAAGDELYVRIHCTAGGNYEVTLKQFAGANLTTTPTATYGPVTVSTDMPDATQACIAGHAIGNGATASAALIAMIREDYRTPF